MKTVSSGIWCFDFWFFWLLAALLVPAAAGAGAQAFGGVGLQVVPIVSGELVVLQVVPGSPAERGGVRPGDLIIQVDRLDLRGSDFAEVVGTYLWGEIGKSITLAYLRPGEQGRRSAQLKRVAMNPEAAAPPGVKMILPGTN